MAIIYSNKGHVREHNEDAIFAAGNIVSVSSMLNPVELSPETVGGCFVVIDGMGGHEGGEKAAQIVAMSFLENSDGGEIDIEGGKEKIKQILTEAVRHIVEAASNNRALASMGAVLAGIVRCSDDDLVFNCGDCRVYRQQGEYLEKLSHDHSIVQNLCDQGLIDEETMRTHPLKSMVTACVSADPSFLHIDFHEVRYAMTEPRSRFFICSDGVWEALSVDDIERYLASGEDMFNGAVTLSKELLALQEQCRDNISFVIV